MLCLLSALTRSGRCFRIYRYYYYYCYYRAICFQNTSSPIVDVGGKPSHITCDKIRRESFQSSINAGVARGEKDTLTYFFKFFRAGLKDRMNLCLFCLSLVDGMFVFSYFLSGSHCLVRLIRPDLQTWWKWSVRHYVMGMYAGFLLCSGCLTMIISVERCVCVFLPLRATSLIRTRTMAVIVFTTIIVIQAISLIYPLKVQTFWYCSVELFSVAVFPSFSCCVFIRQNCISFLFFLFVCPFCSSLCVLSVFLFFSFFFFSPNFSFG